MIATRFRTGHRLLSLGGQVCLSVIGTLAASVAVSQLKAEWSLRFDGLRTPPPATRFAPDLTRGGKFAARAAEGGEAEPFVTLINLPSTLPLFMARPATEAAPAPGDAARDQRPSGRRDIRHAAAAAPLPPRREPGAAVALAALPTFAPAQEDATLWSRSQAAYRAVADWGGTMLDRLMP